MGFADYWSARGRMSFPLTLHLAYRLGAILAVPLGRVGLRANGVTVLSLVIAVGGTAVSLIFLEGRVLQAVGIFLSLGVGYALDCADGMMARVHGQGSLFGAIFDKVCDTISGMVCSAILAGAVISEFKYGGAGAALVAFGVMLGTRLSLDVAMWLKEFTGGEPDRRAEDPRERTLGHKVRRAAGGLTDHALYVIMVSVAWATGFFWEFFIVYHAVVAVMLAAYMVSLHRQFGRGGKK